MIIIKYEYNGNLIEKDRILQVANEITNHYPMIDMKTAMLAATLEKPITTKITGIMEFDRLYNILFAVQNNRGIFNQVYSDIIDVYAMKLNQHEQSETPVDNIMCELIKFSNGERYDFPINNEF